MKKLLLVFLLFTMVVGCQDNQEEFGFVNHEGDRLVSNVISASDACEHAISFINDMKRQTRASFNMNVTDVYPWTREQLYPLSRSGSSFDNLPDTVFYVVNFSDESGYVLVSADKRCEGVLAYVEEGHLSPTDDIDSEGFRFFLNLAGAYISTSLGVETLPAPDTTGYGKPVVPITPVDTTLAFYHDASYLLRTKWHQQSPFNDKCPLFDGVHAPAGCGPVATAQVLAYHKMPKQYKGHAYYWNSMLLYGPIPTGNTGKSSVAQLLYDIGSLENVQYHANGSSIHEIQIKNCLEQMGYHYDRSDYDYARCLTNFENKRPVIISGNPSSYEPGHVWVLDGGFQRKVVIKEELENGGYEEHEVIQNLVHCNFGAKGSHYNGYYLSGVFQTQSKVLEDNKNPNVTQPDGAYDFSHVIKVYYDIYPFNQ